MSNLQSRIEINNEAKERMKLIKFGDAVTNICAGDKNPMKHSYFVRRPRKGIAQCTDKKGNFWDIDIKVIYQGHLDAEKCKELFEPIWQSEYGCVS